MMPHVFAHEGAATSSGMTATDITGETGEATFTHFMGDMMSLHWGSWSPFFIILWGLTWVLIIITLIVLIRWFWIKGGKK